MAKQGKSLVELATNRASAGDVMATKVYRINASTLLKHMLIAEQNGVTDLRFKIGPYAFTAWQVEGKPALYVSFHGPDSSVYLGRIQRNKLFPSPAFRYVRDLRPIEKFIENPLHAAKAYASSAEIPVCACCGRRLGTRDVKNGIGERCMEKWNFVS